MSTTPYFPFYPSDYMADTAHLSTEQHGAYMLLLMTAWARAGRLPNDPAKLARIARVSPRRWHMIADDVLEFWDAEGDEIVSKRLEREHKKASSKSQKRSDAGKRGAKAKALKNKEPASAIAKQTLKHSPEPEPLGTNVPKKDTRKRATRLPEDWVIPDDWLVYAESKGLTRERAQSLADDMLTWSLTKSQGTSLDWKRTYQNWARRAAKDGDTGHDRKPTTPPGGGRGGNYADGQRAAADTAQSAAIRVAERRMGRGYDHSAASTESDGGSHLRVIEASEPGGGSGAYRETGPALSAPAQKRYGG